MDFASNLKSICLEKRFSAEKLAAALNVTEKTVEAWSDGTLIPTLEELLCIASTLKTSVDHLIAGNGANGQKIVFGAPASLHAYGRVTQRGVVDILNQDYLPHGWRVVSTQLFVNAAGEDQMLVVIEK